MEWRICHRQQFPTRPAALIDFANCSSVRIQVTPAQGGATFRRQGAPDTLTARRTGASMGRTTLRSMLDGPEPVFAPRVLNPRMARLAQQTGFPATLREIGRRTVER